MNEQNIIDAINNLVSEIEKLRSEVESLKEINSDLAGKIRLLNSNIENRL